MYYICCKLISKIHQTQNNMKKTTYIISMLILSISTLLAQNPLQKNQTQLNVGVGFSDWGVPVYIGFDHGISKNFSLGGELSYRHYEEYWQEVYYAHPITGLSGNINYHFNNLFHIRPTWDLYAGLNAGFYIWGSPNAYHGTESTGLGLGAQIGARYYISRKVALNLEFGGGNAFSNGKLGLSVKL